MFVYVDYIIQREMRVCDLLGSCLVGKCLYYPKLRYIQTTILHNVQSQHFVRGKGRWEEMRWPDGGMVGSTWVSGEWNVGWRGKGWLGIGAWIGDHGNGDGEMGLGRKMVHIYKHNKMQVQFFNISLFFFILLFYLFILIINYVSSSCIILVISKNG